MKKLLNRFKTKCLKVLYQFAFTKNDRRAMGVLGGLIAISIFLRAYGLMRPAREWFVETDTDSGLIHQTTKIIENKMNETKPTFSTTCRKDSTAKKSNYNPPSYMIKKKFSVDLNLADTFDLQEIYGIGPTFAKRIIRYRKELGGFVRLAQLREVWGIDSSLFNRMTQSLYIQDTNIRKININEADIRTLKQHPYLDYYQAKEIYLHREKFGHFKRVAELKKVNLIDSGTYSRISPYLTVN